MKSERLSMKPRHRVKNKKKKKRKEKKRFLLLR